MDNNIIDKLIICNPYKEPDVNWKYDRDIQGFKKKIKEENQVLSNHLKRTQTFLMTLVNL